MATSPHLRQASNAVTPHHVQSRSCHQTGNMALLRQQLDFPMRPENKEMGWAVPYDQIFDQYVDTDLLDISSDNAGEGTSSSDDLSNLFDLSSSSNGSAAAKTSPMPNWEARHTEPEEVWQQALSYIGSHPASAVPSNNQTSIYPESRPKAVASDSGLFSFEDSPCTPQVASDPFVFSTPSSPYSIPSIPTKKFHSLPTRGKRRDPIALRRTVSRESLSSKMMRPSQYRTGYQEVWAKRVGGALPSPPPSSKVSQEENHFGFTFPPNIPYSNTREVIDLENLSGHNYTSRSHVQITPVASPTTQVPSSAGSSFSHPNENNPYLTHDLHEALQTPPHSARVPSTSWAQDQSTAFDFNFPSQPEPQPWWSTQPSTQPSYQHPRMDSLPISTASSDLATNGLMIQCEPAGMPSILEAHAPDASPFPTSSPVVYPSQMYTTNPVATPTYSHPHPHPHPHVQHQHPHTTPPSRSPTSSPPQPPYSRLRRDSSTRPRSQHRRKSTSALSASAAAQPRPASVGFVNYTPEDSRKILTGVAPSGSSKTKARREKEAAEKRRRLSQAAARAIIEAGGDISTLEREGLLFGDVVESK